MPHTKSPPADDRVVLVPGQGALFFYTPEGGRMMLDEAATLWV